MIDLSWRPVPPEVAQGQSGQIALIVLLMMVTLVTIGVSVGLRTSQNVLLSKQEEDTTRVFNAAETGIDEALSAIFQGETESGSLNTNGVDVDYTIQELDRFEMQVAEGVTPTIDLDGAGNGDDVRIRWGSESNCAEDPAALVISVYYQDGPDTKTQYLVSTPCNRSDGFQTGSVTGDDGLTASAVSAAGVANYSYEQTINLPNNAELMRIKPVYNSTNLYVEAVGWTMPTQYFAITSKASNQTGQENRAVLVRRSLPTASSVFDYALLSGGNLVK